MMGSVQTSLPRDEDTDFEYKRKLDGDSIKRSIVAFANDWQDNGGGTIYVGVEDDGEITGLSGTRDLIQQRAANFASDGSIDPRPSVEVETRVHGTKQVCIIQVRAGQRRPYMLKGRGFIRIGTTTRPTTHEENKTLSKRNASDDPLQGYLPPREEIAIDFIGRRRLLTALWSWLVDPNGRRVALVGQGGSGKSAIAYHFASAVMSSAPEPFQSVIWLSAKSRRLQNRGIEAIKPDFWDLQSAINRLLVTTGYEDMVAESLSEQIEWIKIVLSDQPSLIVVDDYDSLLRETKDSSVANCVDFFTELTFHSKSKLIMTSRVDPRVGLQQPVRGFPQDSRDGSVFVGSRLNILGMGSDQIPATQKQDVLKVTGGIPLFIEDFLRLYKLQGDLNQTISNWRSTGGQRAREFAIKREFDSLPEPARIVLLSASLLEGQVSMDDIRSLTGYGFDDITEANLELQGLFLMSPPVPDGDATVFRVNENIANLVRQELRHTSEFRRVSDALGSLSGSIYQKRVTTQSVAVAIRKASMFVRSDRLEEAENVILEAFKAPGLSEHPDLHGALGWV